MITRRGFLLRVAGTAAAGFAAAGTGIARVRPRPTDADAYCVEGKVTAYFKDTAAYEAMFGKVYQVTCQEIDNQDNILDDGREVSWSTNDISKVPEVGQTIQVEWKVLQRVERFRARVISVTEIK